jgi:hypothetical protein
MDRRGFMVAGAAAALSACAHPERTLIDEGRRVELSLEPGPRRSTSTTTTTTTVPAEIDDGTRTTPEEPVIDFFGSIPDEDRPGLSFVATALAASVTAFSTPELTGPLKSFNNPIESGGRLTFLVEDFAGTDRYKVLLPTRPNGSVGWIDAARVELTRHNYAIHVSLDDFLLTLNERGEPIFQTTVGVARKNAPTPLGRYYTTELIKPIFSNSIYGLYAYGLSGYSDTFTQFAGGDAQLGIHGTNDPASLGTNVSSGCIRLHNDDISLLVEDIGLPLGVPVEVT